MVIEAYVSGIDPNGVDVLNHIDAYLAQSTDIRTAGRPYAYPTKEDVPTVAPRQAMNMSLSGTEGDVDYIVLTYDAAKDGYSGVYYYFAEHIPNDSRDAFGSKLYALRIDSWATLRAMAGEYSTSATGTLIRSHRLVQVAGSEYVSQPADAAKVTGVTQWGPGRTPTQKMALLVELDTNCGNLLFTVRHTSGSVVELQKILSALWLIDRAVMPGNEPFAVALVNKVSRVWLVPHDLATEFRSSMLSYNCLLQVSGTADIALFRALLGDLADEEDSLLGWLMMGQYSVKQYLSLPASPRMRLVGNSIKMVTIPAGGSSSGYFTISLVAPATADRGTVNPSSVQFSFTFFYRGEATEFADTFRVSAGVADNQEMRQAAISDALVLLSGGVSLGASVASGNVVGGVLGTASLVGGISQMLNRKYSRQMSMGNGVLGLMYFFDPSDPQLNGYAIYGMAMITCESSNFGAVSAEALLFGPSGAQRSINHRLQIHPSEDYNALYLQFAPGVRVNRDAGSEAPLYMYRDLERRLEAGVRVWDESEGYCNQ